MKQSLLFLLLLLSVTTTTTTTSKATENNVLECRICGITGNKVITLPEKPVPFVDGSPSCSDIDWYIGQYYPIDSSDCIEAQQLQEFCGCEEDTPTPTEEAVLPNATASSSNATTTTTTNTNSNYCSLCQEEDDNVMKYPNKEFLFEVETSPNFNDGKGFAKTCSQFETYLSEQLVPLVSEECKTSKELLSEFCGCDIIQPITESKCDWCPSGTMTKPDAYMIKNYLGNGIHAKCGDGALFWSELDSNSQVCNEVIQGNFRCGCSEGMGFDHPYTQMTMSKFRWYVWLPRITGFLSLIGSIYIIYDIIVVQKQKRLYVKSTQHQVLMGMSIIDICSSLMYILGPIMAPKFDDEGLWNGNPGSIGTTATCKIQGFFIQLGLAATFYNVSLSTYFYLVIVKSWRESKFNNQSKIVKYVLLFLPPVIGICLAGAAIPYYQGYQGFCDLPVSDLVYYGLLLTVERNLGRNWSSIIGFMIVPLSISILMVTILTLGSYSHVRQIHNRAERWRLSNTGQRTSQLNMTSSPNEELATTSQSRLSRFFFSTSRNNTNNNSGSAPSGNGNSSNNNNIPSTKQMVFHQSLFYLLGFYLTWPLLLAMLCMPIQKVTYAMRLTVVTLLPFQGLHNALVYIRPKYIKRKLEQSRRQLQESSLIDFTSQQHQPKQQGRGGGGGGVENVDATATKQKKPLFPPSYEEEVSDDEELAYSTVQSPPPTDLNATKKTNDDEESDDALESSCP